ncbi:hypothetical protein DFH06DRAFT_143052 [Mycena polygramma]|nr:hypothetical protein DFH06DRAFT_143052 [Mycena polygramma]
MPGARVVVISAGLKIRTGTDSFSRPSLLRECRHTKNFCAAARLLLSPHVFRTLRGRRGRHCGPSRVLARLRPAPSRSLLAHFPGNAHGVRGARFLDRASSESTLCRCSASNDALKPPIFLTRSSSSTSSDRARVEPHVRIRLRRHPHIKRWCSGEDCNLCRSQTRHRRPESPTPNRRCPRSLCASSSRARQTLLRLAVNIWQSFLGLGRLDETLFLYSVKISAPDL